MDKLPDEVKTALLDYRKSLILNQRYWSSLFHDGLKAFHFFRDKAESTKKEKDKIFYYEMAVVVETAVGFQNETLVKANMEASNNFLRAFDEMLQGFAGLRNEDGEVVGWSEDTDQDFISKMAEQDAGTSFDLVASWW